MTASSDRRSARRATSPSGTGSSSSARRSATGPRPTRRPPSSPSAVSRIAGATWSSTACRWPPASSASATRGRAPARPSGAGPRSAHCTRWRCATTSATCRPDPVAASLQWAARTEATAAPWWRDTHAGDVHRLRQMQAEAAGDAVRQRRPGVADGTGARRGGWSGPADAAPPARGDGRAGPRRRRPRPSRRRGAAQELAPTAQPLPGRRERSSRTSLGVTRVSRSHDGAASPGHRRARPGTHPARRGTPATPARRSVRMWLRLSSGTSRLSGMSAASSRAVGERTRQVVAGVQDQRRAAHLRCAARRRRRCGRTPRGSARRCRARCVRRCSSLNASHCSRRAVGQELGGEHLPERRVVAAPADPGQLDVEGRLAALLVASCARTSRPRA